MNVLWNYVVPQDGVGVTATAVAMVALLLSIFGGLFALLWMVIKKFLDYPKEK